MKRLTLSFDNGPTEGTPAVLEALAEWPGCDAVNATGSSSEPGP